MTAGHEPVQTHRRSPAGSPKCGVTTRKGKPCQNTAGMRTEHLGSGPCWKHMGATRNHTVAAAKDLVNRGARGLLDKLGDPQPLTDPVGRLLGLAGEVDHWREACRQQVQELESWYRVDNFGIEQNKAAVRLYEDAMDRAGRLLVDINRLGLEDRRLRLAEQDRRRLAEAIQQGLRAALTPEQADQAMRAIGKALRGAGVDMDGGDAA